MVASALLGKTNEALPRSTAPRPRSPTEQGRQGSDGVAASTSDHCSRPASTSGTSSGRGVLEDLHEWVLLVDGLEVGM